MIAHHMSLSRLGDWSDLWSYCGLVLSPPVQTGDIVGKISVHVSSAKNADKTIYIRTVLNLMDSVCNIYDYSRLYSIHYTLQKSNILLKLHQPSLMYILYKNLSVSPSVLSGKAAAMNE